MPLTDCKKTGYQTNRETHTARYTSPTSTQNAHKYLIHFNETPEKQRPNQLNKLDYNN